MTTRRSHVTAFIVDNSLLLPLGSVVALVWANTRHESYERFADYVHFAVNDVGMALFFAIAAKEIVQATAPGGELHPFRRATTPIVAAVGGMVVPAILYLLLVRVTGDHALAPGWAIPSATDIAFSFLTARVLLGSQHAGIPFLLLLAIADDALGLIVLALFYPSGVVRPLESGVILLVAVGVCWLLRRRRVTNFWPYIFIAGAVSWVAFFRGGLHPSLALVPIVPFVPHSARDEGLFEEAAPQHDPLSEFEHAMRVPVQGVLLMFGLANAGVPLSGIGAGTWIVATALVIGKPLGVTLSILIGGVFGLQLPRGVTTREVIVIGCVAGIGFTVALFFCTASFAAGELLDQTKMGALFSFAAALIAAVMAWALRVGRFAL